MQDMVIFIPSIILEMLFFCCLYGNIAKRHVKGHLGVCVSSRMSFLHDSENPSRERGPI